jgi:hypothetical protein
MKALWSNGRDIEAAIIGTQPQAGTRTKSAAKSAFPGDAKSASITLKGFGSSQATTFFG